MKTVIPRLAGLLVMALPVLADVPPPPPKTHLLFMGTELALQRDKKFHRVEDVTKDSYLIVVDGREVLVPVKRKANVLKIDRALKLTEVSVELRKFVGERAYTTANDPRRQMESSAGAAASAGAVLDLANFQLNEAQQAMAGARSSAYTPPETMAALGAQLEKAEQQAQMASEMQYSSQNQTGTHADRMQSQMAEGNHDALEVAFEVASEVPLDDPHFIVIARIRERGARPGQGRTWIYGDSLPPIGANPRYVRIKEGGFPPGYILENCEVHLFNRGREIATNLSSNRVALTREEAQQYLLIEYLDAHKGETIAAKPLMGELPADLKARVAAGEFSQTACYVRVDIGGRALGVFSDAAGAKPMKNPYLESLFANLLFAPALEKGKPVPAITRVELDRLSL